MGIVYKLSSSAGTYIGSTKGNLEKRFKHHIHQANNPKQIRKCTSSKIINGDNLTIELIEDCDDAILLEREKYWILITDCVNKVVPNRSRKEHYAAKKERFQLQSREWYHNNKDKVNEIRNKKYQENKDNINQKRRETRKNDLVECICGSSFRKSNKWKHEQSMKHRTYLHHDTE